MSISLDTITQASGLRRARTYEPVYRALSVADEYPVGCSAFLSSIHDARYYQGILSNSRNFSSESKCDLLHVQDGSVEWRSSLRDDDLIRYLQDPAQGRKPVFRVIFGEIEHLMGTSFGCQLSFSKTTVLALLNHIQISPQYLSLLLGEPDYWAPGDFASTDEQGKLHRIEFFAQQPRWNIHKRETPWSIYMSHSLPEQTTTYVVVCSHEQASNVRVKERLADIFRSRASGPNMNSARMPDPFELHVIITHEALIEAKAVITDMRGKLYDALDMVDTYSKQPASHRSRATLESLTLQLHVVSQDTDSVAASADMAGMIVRRIADAHKRYAESNFRIDEKDIHTKTNDAIKYLEASIESQKRWLGSYKSRKDIAMNLVFNLVTQQDAATSTTIAREAKADGTSVKIIAALTMVFLPGTFLSSVFGMASLSSARWWLYIALTLPLTLVVLLVWWIWLKWSRAGTDSPSFARRDSSKTV